LLFACRADWSGTILFAGAALMYGAFSAVRGRLAAA